MGKLSNNDGDLPISLNFLEIDELYANAYRGLSFGNLSKIPRCLALTFSNLLISSRCSLILSFNGFSLSFFDTDVIVLFTSYKTQKFQPQTSNTSKTQNLKNHNLPLTTFFFIWSSSPTYAIISSILIIASSNVISSNSGLSNDSSWILDFPGAGNVYFGFCWVLNFTVLLL